MKNILTSFFFVLLSGVAFGQECDSLANVCYNYLTIDAKRDKIFISDGQVYKAFVDAEQSAEFKVTLYGGSLYRIAASAGDKANYVIFNVYDKEQCFCTFFLIDSFKNTTCK